ncbi:hypothetical protein GCM10011610_20870 [Nocardia rhizosphaerihabitans]|uniref:Type I restriction modification DNA specificity domain-containing protein n=2 Tax=Nocardia rhizosphaerihabitans TaxID=1691570 RepID=A0ABQ2KA49_9NOCA|nr:hypothetical protein GCM10011610_20870 [Nocardia rhizosphaerihabitans]
MVSRAGSVDPAKHPDEIFELYSIPAYDAGQPDITAGAQIGSTKQIVQGGDVLLSKIVPHIRRAWIVSPHTGSRLIASGEWIIFRSNTFDPNYLRHLLMSDAFHRQFMNTVAGVGGSLLRARPAFVARIAVPLPAMHEQRRIAEVLDQVDALRGKRRKSISLLDDLTQSIFLDMFSSASSELQSTTVEELAAKTKNSIRTGPFGSQLLHEEFVDEGVPVLGIDNAVDNEFKWGKSRYITDTKYRQLQRYTVFPGDVLITIMGTCGRCAVVPDDIPTAINTKHLCCITLDQRACLPEYLHSYFLQHPIAQQYLRQTAKGAIMSGLNMGIIKSLPVALPPLRLQESYAQRIRQIREARSTAERHLRRLDTLFASIQFRAFRGELWQDDLKDL